MYVTLTSEAREYAASHPTREGKTWQGWCGSLMWRMCEKFGVAPTVTPSSASEAALAARPLNPDFTQAPAGAFHYWDITKDGHVGLDTAGGGTNVFMASSRLREPLGDAIGFQSVKAYTISGVKYLGWSMTYGKDGTINVPFISPALGFCLTNGIITSPDRPVDIETIAGAVYKALVYLGKA